MMRISGYLKFLSVIALLCFGMVVVINLLFADHTGDVTTVAHLRGWTLVWTILIHNSQNFILTLIGFPIFPAVMLLNWGEITMQIGLYAGRFGAVETIKRLLPHGLIEFPNIAFYQYLSYQLFKLFWKKQAWSKIGQYVKSYYHYWVISYLLLVLSALLEGVIG